MSNRERVVTAVDGQVHGSNEDRDLTSRPLQSRPGYCAYCGARLEADVAAAERFGERFCSEAHAGHFVEGVRSARMTEIAGRETRAAACSVSTGRTWTDRVKRSVCWGAPLLLLLAIPLFWSGNALLATGGSLLSVLAVLACPIGMYFMMRAMMPGPGEKHSGPGETQATNRKEDRGE